MIKFYKCTASQYASLTKSADDFYYITDTNKFYLGTIELSNQDLANYLTEVKAKDNSITISNSNEIAVKLSSKVGNNISLQTGSGEEGLYVSVPAATNYTVAITETSGSSSDPYAKRYNVVQSATGLNVNIDIPKDMVVESGSVVDITYSNNKLYDGSTDVTTIIKGSGGTATAADAGKYIKLVIADSNSTVIYIAAKDLVDIYTAQPNATQVQLAVSNSNVISGSIVAGSIDTTELKNGAVTTDKIAAKAVTDAKLSDAVNASLSAANSALQASDITASDSSTGTNGTFKVKNTEIAIKGLGSAAYTNADAYATAAQGAKADTAIQSVTTGTTNGTIKVDGSPVSVYGLGSAAYTNSTAYATAAQGTAADSALQKADITTGTTNGTIKVKGDAVAVYGLGSAAYADTTDFDAAGAASTVQSTVIGTSNDAASANTIYGAKAYAASILE